MQTTSTLYRSIISGTNYWFETQLVIDNVGTFGENKIFSIDTNIEMLQNEPAIGKAVAGEIEIRMELPDVTIPAMATLRPKTRVCNDTQQSEWLPQGVFFIDTRERTKNDDGLDILTIHGFDAMLKAEQEYPSTSHNWPYQDLLVVKEIAAKMGVSVDSRTDAIMTANFQIPLPASYTCREVLGYIAAMYAGSFIMTDEGKLRLVTLLELPAETNYLVSHVGDTITFGGVRILV